MDKDNLRKPPSAGEIVLIAFSTAVLALIMTPFISMKSPTPEKSVKYADVAKNTTASTTYVTYTSASTEITTTTPAGFYPDNRDVYCVGDEYAPEEYYMAEGVYMLIAESDDHEAYFQKLGTDDENWQEMVDCHFQYSCIVKLEKGWDFIPAYCDAYSLEYFDSLDMENSPFEHGGMFRVGTDIPSGTYKIVPSDEQKTPLWTIHKNIDSIDYDKIYCDEHDGNEITLKDGEILEMQFCCLEKNS